VGFGKKMDLSNLFSSFFRRSMLGFPQSSEEENNETYNEFVSSVLAVLWSSYEFMKVNDPENANIWYGEITNFL
jgi:ClpP class serine protease